MENILSNELHNIKKNNTKEVICLNTPNNIQNVYMSNVHVDVIAYETPRAPPPSPETVKSTRYVMQ